MSAWVVAVGLARAALLDARGGFENSPRNQARLAADFDAMRTELALVREELRIKTTRLARIAARERPRYAPVERLAILALRAAVGWSRAETARRFHVCPATIADWTVRLERGEDALVRATAPVNRYPDFVRGMVRALRVLLPATCRGGLRSAQYGTRLR